ncbi:MAG TPA: hypothetical protein VHJ20_12190 [Polyangia bacterium]|nr:hypothetical protein [Polyangia bacterium]
MKKLVIKKLMVGMIAGVVTTLALAVAAPKPAAAKVVAVYASGSGGVQSTGTQDPGLGVTVGARVLIFDGYLDYVGFGNGEAVSRGILGLRGGFGTRAFRLVLRGGGGAIHEERGALTGWADAPSRTGVVGRLGAAIEGEINPLFYLGFGFDGETWRFPNGVPGDPTVGSDVFASLRLTFELGI